MRSQGSGSSTETRANSDISMREVDYWRFPRLGWVLCVGPTSCLKLPSKRIGFCLVESTGEVVAVVVKTAVALSVVEASTGVGIRDSYDHWLSL
jgi:hypothetical protein